MPASKTKPKKKLNPKQRLFVAEYLIDLNKTQAYIRAGYSPKEAESGAARLYRNVHIEAEIKKRLKALYDRLEVSKERTTRELAGLAHSNVEDYIAVEEDGSVRVKTFAEMPRGASKAIKKIREKRRILSTAGEDVVLESTLEFELYDKIKPNELLGKEQGMFKDKLQVEGGPFVIVKREYGEGKE